MRPNTTPDAWARAEAPALHPIHADSARRLHRGAGSGAPDWKDQHTPTGALSPRLIHRLAVEGLLP